MLINPLTGCLYKHEMPTDIFMLEKLGLRDIPRWYREKYDVPSLLQAGYGNQHRGQQQQAAIDQPQQRAIHRSVYERRATKLSSECYLSMLSSTCDVAHIESGPLGYRATRAIETI